MAYDIIYRCMDFHFCKWRYENSGWSPLMSNNWSRSRLCFAVYWIQFFFFVTKNLVWIKKKKHFFCLEKKRYMPSLITCSNWKYHHCSSVQSKETMRAIVGNWSEGDQPLFSHHHWQKRKSLRLLYRMPIYIIFQLTTQSQAHEDTIL